MKENFDFFEAKNHLSKKEKQEKELLEKDRLEVMNRTLSTLKECFKEDDVKVFLVGSLISPGKFNQNSDIDIVLKNFHGDRFELWVELERKINRKVEIILYEKCNFQEYIDQYGLKVI